MKFKAIPISLERHSKTRIKQTGTVQHLEELHIAPVYSFEFVEAAAHYPILFIKNKEGSILPVLLWGIKPEENLFVKDGNWLGGFMPAVLKLFPFVINNTKDDGKFALGIYENADIVNEQEGELILTEEGKKTEWFKNIVQGIEFVVEQERKSKECVDLLNDEELFISQEIKFKADGEDETIVGGFYVIDREKFINLSAETIKKWQESGILDIVYAHFSSLHNLSKVLKLYSDK